MARRGHERVLADVLSALGDGSLRPLTSVATRANVPYDRLVRYLLELQSLGLLEFEPAPHPTPEGRRWLALVSPA